MELTAAGIAAIAIMLAVWLCRWDDSSDRLLHTLPGEQRAPTPIGAEAALHAVIARLRSGGTPTRAFEEVGHIRFATMKLTPQRIARVLKRRSDRDESAESIATVSRYAAQACMLSERLGCPASTTLEAVAKEHHRMRLLEERRKQVFAAPQATIKLLSFLPAVTLLLGEVLGASPLLFLLGSLRGWICLGIGACWYMAGMAWIRRMMRGFTTCDLEET